MIETVLGPIRPEQMQACLSHEHLTVYGTNEASIAIRGKALRDIVPQLRELRRKYRCNALVECTPSLSTGRDLETYAEIARQAKFHVIATTGFYVFDRASWWMTGASTKDLVKRWKREVRDGMDGTGIRPGVLKASCGKEICDRRRRNYAEVIRWHEALVRTHLETGLPITTHVCGPLLSQLNVLLGFGAKAEAIMLCHADSNPNPEHLLIAVDKGAYLSFNFGRNYLVSASAMRRNVALIKSLIDHGHLDQLTLSVDAAFWPHRSLRLDPDRHCPEGKRSKRIFKHVFTKVRPALEKAGVSRRQIRQMLVVNPRRHLDIPVGRKECEKRE